MKRLTTRVLLLVALGQLTPACGESGTGEPSQRDSVEASGPGAEDGGLLPVDGATGDGSPGASLQDGGCLCPQGFEACSCSDGPAHPGGGQSHGRNPDKSSKAGSLPDADPTCCCCPVTR